MITMTYFKHTFGLPLTTAVICLFTNWCALVIWSSYYSKVASLSVCLCQKHKAFKIPKLSMCKFFLFISTGIVTMLFTSRSLLCHYCILWLLTPCTVAPLYIYHRRLSRQINHLYSSTIQRAKVMLNSYVSTESVCKVRRLRWFRGKR